MYRATDTKLKRQVAIKVLPHAALAGDAERLTEPLLWRTRTEDLPMGYLAALTLAVVIVWLVTRKGGKWPRS